MEYGTLTRHEQLELQDLANRELAIQSLMDRLIKEQMMFTEKRDVWFGKIREKYKIPNDVALVVDEQSKIQKA